MELNIIYHFYLSFKNIFLFIQIIISEKQIINWNQDIIVFN